MSATVVAEESVASGTRLPPGARFRKVWRVRNTGTKAWNSRTSLKYCWGNELFETEGKVKEVNVPRLRPWEEGRIALNFVAPHGHFNGQYQSHWRLHHRGQPFGQRLICQIVVDPRAPVPEKALPEWKPRKVKSREAKARKAQKDLAEAAVKMIRFQEMVVKSQLQSHTATPLNTPFDGPSPPKSPEPGAQPPVLLNEGTDPRPANTRDFGFSPDESQAKSVHEKEIQVQQASPHASRGASLDDPFGWSSPESSDEFVVVQLPKCFDLNTPFDVQEFNKLAQQLQAASLSDDEPPFQELPDERHEGQQQDQDQERVDACPPRSASQVLVDVSDVTSLSDSSDFENVEHVSLTSSATAQPTTLPLTPLTPERVEVLAPQVADVSRDSYAYEPVPVDGSSTEPSLLSQAQAVDEVQQGPQQTSEAPLIHSTNPFLNRRPENVIHVLPESIVNGAVSAATQVVQNVSRVLFSPHVSCFLLPSAPSPTPFTAAGATGRAEGRWL